IDHLHGKHDKCWPEVCWIVENPDLELGIPNLITYSIVQCKDLEEFLRKIMKLPGQQSLITTIRTSANKAINYLKLNYTDKKTDYLKSFAARHALAVLHNNVGLEQREYRRAANVAKIEARNQARAQKIMNQKACLEGFNFDQDLVPYGQIVQKSLETMQFHPSFATKIPNFKTIINCSQQMPNRVYHNKDKDEPDSKNRMLDAIVSEVFNFTEFRPKQRESIDSFTAGNDTLCILPTGGGKTFIYASSALLFMGLTVVFTPLKALMGDQMQELVNIGIPSAILYVSSEQSPDVQEAIFSEIASGFIRILLVTPEKYIKNLAFS
ncbi:12096_t:CDS:2, partial [Racocetra persica]